MGKQFAATVGLGLVLALFCATASASKFGDEQFRDSPNGYFVSFAPGRFDVVDPEGGTIVKTVQVEDAIWGDAVYIQSDDGETRFLVVGEQTTDQIVVIDVDSIEIVARLDMGDRPSHLYAVHFRNEVWAHADGNGTFDVLSIDDTSRLLREDFQAHVDEGGHGKLLFDEDLGNVGYATNVREGVIIEIDLETKEHPGNTVKFWNLTELNDDGYVCPGTHGIAYSKINRHLYVECTGSAGIFEFSIDEGRVVKVFPQLLNQAFTTPDEGFILVVNKKNSTGHVLRPQATGTGSTEEFVFDIPGEPDQAAFFPKGPRGDNPMLEDYYVFFSLVVQSEDSGVAWVDLEEVVNSGDQRVAAENIPVGQVGGPHRSIRRGGGWIATHTHAPQEALAIIDAEAKEVLHIVEGVGSGARVSYVPRS